jgi:hypothetical protein
MTDKQTCYESFAYAPAPALWAFPLLLSVMSVLSVIHAFLRLSATDDRLTNGRFCGELGEPNFVLPSI